MNRFALFVAFAVLWALSPSGTAAANEMVLVSQYRVVAGSGEADDFAGESGFEADSSVAPDAGPFDDARNGTVLLSEGVASGGGEQSSSISPLALFATASHFSNAEIWGGDGFASASGRCVYDVWFTVAQSCGYTLSGFVEEFDSGSTSVRLSDDAGTVHYFPAPSNDSAPYSVQGTLTPGQYRIYAITSGSSFGDPFFAGYSSGAFEMSFLLDAATDAPVVARSAPAAFPNPFRAATRLTAPEGARSLTVFDAAGRVVTRLAVGDAVRWDGRDESGRPVPAGVYFLRADVAKAPAVRVVRLR